MSINIRTDSEIKSQAQTMFADFPLGDDGEDTLAQSLADMDNGVRGFSTEEFDFFMKSVISKEGGYSG